MFEPRSTWDMGKLLPLRAMPQTNPSQLEVHHTVTPGQAVGQEAIEAIRAIYRYHTGTKGWSDIYYHYILAPDGVAYEARNNRRVSSTQTALTVCVLGNYDQDELTPAIKNKLIEINSYFGYTKPWTWHAQRAAGTRYASACPGKNMIEWLKAGHPPPVMNLERETMDRAGAEYQVRWAYENILGRTPDDGGFNYWVERLLGGLSVHDMRWEFTTQALKELRADRADAPAPAGGRDPFVQGLIDLAKNSG